MSCIYLCSNLEIADQNQDKLTGEDTSKLGIAELNQGNFKSEKTRKPPTRLTLIPHRAASIQKARKKKKHQLFVFTPNTSLDLVGATGIKSERRMLFGLSV